ncbi:MAG: MauE/DoxX family redox-associated membrane protein [Melioribacteraceae bacterium]
MKNKITLLLHVLVGIVFIFSAYSKLIAPGIVEIILVDHGLAASRESAGFIVRILISLELALGLLFFQPFSLKRIVIPFSSLFLIGFTAYLGYTGFILHDSQNCGCFGEMIKISPLESIIKNVLLMGLLAILFKRTEEKKNYFAVPLVTLASFIIVFTASPVKSYKDFKFAKYTNFVNAGRVDLSHGDKLIAVFNTECDHCQNLAKELSGLKKKAGWSSNLYALLFSEGTISADSFKAVTNFNYPYRMIKLNEFLDLIGQSPPRIYWLHKGSVKEFWDKDFTNHLNKNFMADQK